MVMDKRHRLTRDVAVACELGITPAGVRRMRRYGLLKRALKRKLLFRELDYFQK